MLQSKFAKKKQGFRAQKIFTDRIKPSTVFYGSIEKFKEKPQEIIVYYGKGGIGKSTLLKNLLKNTQDAYKEHKDTKIHSIFVSLDAYEYSNPVNILMSIRNGIYGDCSLFDYALMQYCAKTKMSVGEIMNKNSLFSSPIMDILNEVISLGTASACIPTAALQKCVSLIRDTRFKERYREEIEELSGFNEFELFERLPYYLGLCLSYAAEKGNLHVIFLDSYESLLIRTVGGTPSVGAEDWLKELFLSTQSLRIVIASRDRLRWEKEDEDWKQFMNQHLLNNLSDEDSGWFLHQVPIDDETVVQTIVKHAGGVPLYLDMCVDIYENDINEGKPFRMQALQRGEKIIDRYMRHLNKKDQYAVRVLSMLRSFDEEFAIQLLRLQNLIYSKEELEELFEKSIILPIEETKGLWKVDESVRLHLHEELEISRKKQIFDHILECVRHAGSGKGFPYLAVILEIAADHPAYLENVMQEMNQEIDYYANAGFWNELHSILKDGTTSSDERLKTIAVMEELIWLRRTGQLKEAERLSLSCPLQKEYLGIWFYMYQYLLIQIRHLMGFYDESIVAYKKLVDEMSLIRTLIPVHIYNMVFMKYADILFLKGRFSESLKLVEELLSCQDTPLVDQIELMRIKGHIYRFQGQYSKAEIIYRSVLKMIQDGGLYAYEGKLYSNMTEVLCMTNPQEALEWFEKAQQKNTQMGNDIEVGKAQAAASAANTVLKNIREGISLAKQAIVTAEKTGYKSGRAFGLAALHFAYCEAGEETLAVETYAQLEAQLKEIGVYHYILKKGGVK